MARGFNRNTATYLDKIPRLYFLVMHLVHKRPFLYFLVSVEEIHSQMAVLVGNSWQLKATGVESTKPSLSIPVEELKPELLEGFPLVFLW